MIEFTTQCNIKNLPPEGKSYKGVIGKQYSLLKSFMIRKEINGPSWIKIKGSVVENDNTNRSNFLSINLKDESYLTPFNSVEIPPISVLSVQTFRSNGKVGAISFGKYLYVSI